MIKKKKKKKVELLFTGWVKQNSPISFQNLNFQSEVAMWPLNLSHLILAVQVPF